MLMAIFGTRGVKYAKIVIVGFASILLIVGIAIFFLSNRNSPHIYIALGDSVSSGYGLIGYETSPEGRHTSLFFARLEQGGYVDEYHNFATSGFTTTDLLAMLYGMSNEELLLFRNARVITLNIGGNNILTPFLTYLSDLRILSGAGNIVTGTGSILSGAWGVIYEIISGVGSVVSDSEETSLSIGGIITSVGDILSGLGELIVGTGEIVAGSYNVVSTWRGLLSPRLETMFEDGVQTFSEEFRGIIMWLEINAPNATIIVNTLYNPIPQDILTVSVPISNWANVLIKSMNQAIVKESELRGFLITDIGYYFSNQTNLMSFNLNPLVGDISFDIVHPSAEGHELIAQLNYATFVGSLAR